MTSRFPNMYGFFVLICLAYAASDGFQPIPSKDLSTARCRVFCLRTDLEFLRSNESDSCSSLQSCSTNGGCSTACNYWLIHKNKDAITTISSGYQFDKPIALVNSERTFLYWLVPTAIDGTPNPTIVYAIFIKEASSKNTTFVRWKQIKQTSSVSVILLTRILPTQLIRLVAISEKGIVANIYFQTDSISFPEYFRHNTALDKGLFRITEFLWTSPSSRVSTTIQQIPNGRVQAALSWQESVKEHGPRSVYKVLWRMLSCHVYQNLEPCYLHDHYNVTLVSVLRNVQAHLKIDLRFNSEYIIQVEKIIVGADTEKEVTSSNVDAALTVVHTPRCIEPDSSFFFCKSLLFPRSKRTEKSGSKSTLNWLPFGASLLSMFGFFILLCILTSFCWNKNISGWLQKEPIP